MPTKFTDVKAGDLIAANGTHKCIRPGAVLKVYASDGLLADMHVMCDDPIDSRHYLFADEDGNLVGFQKLRQQRSNVPAHPSQNDG